MKDHTGGQHLERLYGGTAENKCRPKDFTTIRTIRALYFSVSSALPPLNGV